MQRFLIILILFFSSLTFSDSKEVAIVVHGGAGWFENMPEEQVNGILEGLENAMNIGYEILSDGGSSLDAVEQAIIYLEDNELFNAGKGAVYTSELRQELDASIMYGLNNDAGAVASVTNVKNPISLARYIMENTKLFLR